VGLALTKELVDLLKGKIGVASTPGVGSRFAITLPVRAIDFPPEWLLAPSGESELFPKETGVVLPVNKRIENAPTLLIAEDDPDLRRYLVECLVDSFTVIEAIHGEQAWRLALRHSPDVMITDWMMPEMEGLELCKRLKNDERTSHIPLVMLTAKSSQASQLEGLAFGADDYIGKPFSAALLKRRVQNLIDNRRRLREAFSQEVWLRPSDVKLTSLDEVFLQKATALVEAHIDDPHFDANQLEKNLNMSQMQLYRKLKNLTDLSARDFIRYVRLQRAAQLLTNSQLTVSEIAYQVGFNDPGYFARCFKKQFNQSPLSYAKEIGKEKDA
jgi:YesN/AraC family two-component response regulator